MLAGLKVDQSHNQSLAITVDELDLAAGSLVNADGQGYPNGRTAGYAEFVANVAGSHGGIGARYWAVPNFMPTYGSFAWPDYPGSGSGRNDQYGGPGCGFIVIEAGTIVVDGTISANAAFENDIQSSPGSGGAIRVKARALSLIF